MEKYKRNISIYSNLPSGGALELANKNYEFLKGQFQLAYLSDAQVKPKNLLHYLYICIHRLPLIHKDFARKINEKGILIAYHSWLTKSPHILRYAKQPKIYICQEVMREYYDDEHKKIQSLKERIVNILRLPIKYIDKRNLKAKSLIVVANSVFSKSLIDKYYGVDSKLIYPGIDTIDFQNNWKIKKANQIISVGAINKLKGYDFLVQVTSQIDINIRPKLVIIGNGVDKDFVKKIQESAKKLNVQLKIKVNISKPDLIKEYFKSKIFMYAPINEPFGIVVEEAMATGLPLIVYKKGGGYIEILNNNNGFILDELDTTKWAEKTKALLEDEKLMNLYGSYNRKFVKKYFDAKIMNNNLLKLIKSL